LRCFFSRRQRAFIDVDIVQVMSRGYGGEEREAGFECECMTNERVQREGWGNREDWIHINKQGGVDIAYLDIFVMGDLIK